MGAARQAFGDPTWRNLTPTARGKLLVRLADLICVEAERLAAIEVQDNGKLMSEMLAQLLRRCGRVPCRRGRSEASEPACSFSRTVAGPRDFKWVGPQWPDSSPPHWRARDSRAPARPYPSCRAGPYGLVVPKVDHPADVAALSEDLSRLEAQAGIAAGTTRLIVLLESPGAVLTAAGYLQTRLERLSGITWGAEDLAAAWGVRSWRDADGEWSCSSTTWRFPPRTWWARKVRDSSIFSMASTRSAPCSMPIAPVVPRPIWPSFWPPTLSLEQAVAAPYCSSAIGEHSELIRTEFRS